MNLKEIGKVKVDKGFNLVIDQTYKAGLKGLDGFSHLLITWWADHFDDEESRTYLTCQKPYKTGPDELGIFATRSPIRPNPICVTVISVKDIDFEKGIVSTYYIDAEDETPILDIKPYYPCSDRVRDFKSPKWCDFLPGDIESSASFDWSKFFNF
ncbi:SAM-dependent methyltransferase [Acidaminobacter sp. JC074]|uniref:TrmO family methyltransferase domain-containing protein n=1 Tax=Acidaminobacter sp. JC074 TaxID=2530199 RepID=UPI001F0E97F6|nr:TrmO family methyltransferase [Acidaminobacter sp. JC074]MCH4886636.1 SAM-dependent methyltransferase [Acidaminobacter sp. JC074]